MDVLETCFRMMSPSEHRLFCEELRKKRNARKDYLLAEKLIASDVPADELSDLLYGEPSSNAYHSLRKRLQVSVMRFLAERHREAEQAPEIRPSGEALVVARMMLKRGYFKQALTMLRRAEREAIAAELPIELDVIYREIMRNAVELETDPEPVAMQWKENRSKIERQRQFEVAGSLLRARLHALERTQQVPDLDDIAQSVLTTVHIDRAAANDPSFMFLLCQMIRNAVIRTKDYHRFEPFVGRIYRGFIRSNGLGKNAEEHAGFLYMYAHVLYRNRRFEEAMIHLDELRKIIVASGQLLRHMRPKYLLLRAAVKSFSGLCEEAAEDLERALQDATIHLHPRDRLNLLLNLSVYYFQAAKYKEANQSILRMSHKESWIEKHLGMEWAFKKNLIEVIIFAELGNDEIALSRIRYIESHFSQFFEQRMYKRAKVFTAFIKRIVQNPDVVRDSAFLAELDRADLGLPGDREDIQAITFFCWVKCKVNGTNYYEELLMSVQRR